MAVAFGGAALKKSSLGWPAMEVRSAEAGGEASQSGLRGRRPAEPDSHGAVIPLVTGVRRGSRGAGPAVTFKTSLSQRSDAWSRVLVSEGHGPLGEEREPRNRDHRKEANTLPPPLERARELSERVRGLE